MSNSHILSGAYHAGANESSYTRVCAPILSMRSPHANFEIHTQSTITICIPQHSCRGIYPTDHPMRPPTIHLCPPWRRPRPCPQPMPARRPVRRCRDACSGEAFGAQTNVSGGALATIAWAWWQQVGTAQALQNPAHRDGGVVIQTFGICLYRRRSAPGDASCRQHQAGSVRRISLQQRGNEKSCQQCV